MLLSCFIGAHLADHVARAAAAQGLTPSARVVDRLAEHFGTTARSAADRRPASIETDLPLPSERAVRIAQQAAALARTSTTETPNNNV